MKLPLAAAGLLLTLCAGAATGGEDAAKTPAGTAVNAPVPEGQAAQVHAAEAPAAEVQVARQKHSIQPCQGDDKRCARAWYGEYKAGILAELKHYRGLAGEIRRLHQAQDAAGAKALLDRLVAENRKVRAVGKIGDIFAHKGISTLAKANGNMALFDATLEAMDEAEDGDLVFTNFVDFDMLYGHRRDVPGYAAALEAFDRRLPEVARKMRLDDLVILTADHGCDPTWRGTDHTRERVPVLAFGPAITPGERGLLGTFADIGETVAAHLSIPPGKYGKSFL